MLSPFLRIDLLSSFMKFDEPRFIIVDESSV